MSCEMTIGPVGVARLGEGRTVRYKREAAVRVGRARMPTQGSVHAVGLVDATICCHAMGDEFRCRMAQSGVRVSSIS